MTAIHIQKKDTDNKMNYLYEESDILNSPFEAFIFDTTKEYFPISAHWHYFIEILYMLEGTAYVMANQQDYILEPNDVIIFYPQVIHSISFASKTPLKYAVLKFDLHQISITSNYSPKLSLIFRYAEQYPDLPILLHESDFKGIPLDTSFFNCIYEIDAKKFGYDMQYQAHISFILIQIIRVWEHYGLKADDILSLPEDAVMFHDIMEYIDSHIGEPIKISALAGKMNMSYYYFAKLFHKIYGQSCSEYIEFIRLNKAKDLLRFTTFDLTYISQETGFSDCSHLIRKFKRRYGITPHQFRLQLKHAT